MTEQAIIDQLKINLKPSRFVHTLGVVESACMLAERFPSDSSDDLSAEQHRVRIAALLHDCAKNLSDEELLSIAEHHLEIDDVIRSEPQLLHGPVGAVIAERDYGITDPDILNAITFHTTGRPKMSRLEQIIYLADFIEPGRQYSGVVSLRKTAEKDFEAAMIQALTNTICHVAKLGGVIHPLTIITRNEFLLRRKRKKCKI